MLASKLSFWFALGVVTTVTPAAYAFEGLTRVGVGVGGTSLSGTPYDAGGLAGLNASYGLSDVFDAQLELALSPHALELSDGTTTRNWLFTAGAGVHYKLDVLQWVPYFGLLAGYHGSSTRFVDREGETIGLGQHGAFVAVPLGVDYLYSRQLAFGINLRSSTFLLDPSTTQLSAQLRAAYQFGY